MTQRRETRYEIHCTQINQIIIYEGVSHCPRSFPVRQVVDGRDAALLLTCSKWFQSEVKTKEATDRQEVQEETQSCH